VDIGGIHIPVAGDIVLNPGGNTDAAAEARFGLQNGQVYEIVVFQAERKLTSSSYKLTLSGFNAAESDCKPICGDGVMTPGEQCDDGILAGEYGGCAEGCVIGPRCGDGILQEDYE
jgi:cysteine-rich repeat protein